MGVYLMFAGRFQISFGAFRQNWSASKLGQPFRYSDSYELFNGEPPEKCWVDTNRHDVNPASETVTGAGCSELLRGQELLLNAAK